MEATVVIRTEENKCQGGLWVQAQLDKDVTVTWNRVPLVNLSLAN